MLATAPYALHELDEIARLIHEHPWATLVSATSGGVIASHLPVLLEDGAGLSLVSHLGRPDDVRHELGAHEVLVIVQGPHGYVSPGWYGGAGTIPTWNHVTAHLYGTPEILDEDANLRVLATLVDRFEREMPSPVRLADRAEHARHVARGTVGIRVRVTRFEARRKLSQDKPPAVVERIIAELADGAHHRNPALAHEMSRLSRGR